MKLIEKLKLLVCYYGVNRRVGHTSTMMKGVLSSKKCIILTNNTLTSNDLKKQWDLGNGCKFISLNSLDNLRGFRYPLCIDNAAMFELLSQSLTEIERLTEENEKTKTQLNKVRQIIL